MITLCDLSTAAGRRGLGRRIVPSEGSHGLSLIPRTDGQHSGEEPLPWNPTGDVDVTNTPGETPWSEG